MTVRDDSTNLQAAREPVASGATSKAGRPRRILIVAERISPTGGTGAHALASIAALQRDGADVVVVVGEEGSGGRGNLDAQVIPGIGGKPAPAESRAQLADLIARVGPDLIHIQQLPDGDLVELARSHAPVLFNVHNYVACTSGWKYFRQPGRECHRAHGPGCVPNLILRGCAHARDPRDLPAKYRRTTQMLRGLRAADAVVAHSAFVADHLLYNGVKRTQLVPLFLDPMPSPSRLPPTGPIVFSGRVTPAKGVGTFLRAVAPLDAGAEICGDGWWMPKARRLAAELGIEDRVAFRGWLRPEELARAYERASIVVVPSHWPEPFGLVGLEAMAHGRPVVATSTGGIPEWLTDGETGLLVRPGDAGELRRALAQLLSDRELSVRLGACAAERAAARFTVDLYLQAISRAYAIADQHWHGTA